MLGSPRLSEVSACRFVGEVTMDTGFTSVHRQPLPTHALRDKFISLFDSVSNYAVFMIDRDGRILSWNPGVAQIFGYSEAEFVDMDSRLLFIEEERVARVPESEMQTAQKEGEAWDFRWHLKKDGSRFWADGLLTAVKGPGEAPSGFIKILRDATEQKLQQDALQRREKELAEANQIKDVFIATLSHELRNPLNIIMGFTEILKAEIDPAQSSQIEAIEAIERSARLQNQLVNDLLDMSRIISGKFTIERQEVDLSPLLASLVAGARVAAEKKSIELRTQIEKDGGTVSGDAGRLQQVFMNIINNAIKFTPEQGWVEIHLERLGQELCLRVRDSGKGISPAFLPHVFERFRQQQVGSARKHGGLGLGLSIARDLVELHGGRIEAESEGEGCGATFIIRLPCSTPHF